MSISAIRTPTGLASALAGWAFRFRPGAGDQELARRALLDTVSVAVAARHEPVTQLAGSLPEAAHWAAAAHALDYDDLHLPSTAHISAVCVSATLAAGGGAEAYLAGAGVMARLGTLLGWNHYQRGWHATCTAGAPAAAIAAGIAMGLDEPGLATAMALAVPSAGGVQRAFGTMAKPLQVGLAAAAGVQAARLAEGGATADPGALEEWMRLVGGSPQGDVPDFPAVPGGLAIKVYPCCYALQRPIAAVASMGLEAGQIACVRCVTPAAALQPLIHHRPVTGLEGKFSLEYAVAAAVLDHPVGFASFTDGAVRRPDALTVAERVVAEGQPGASGLLDGKFVAEVTLKDGSRRSTHLTAPTGAPARPPSVEELHAKVEDCCGALTDEVLDLDWRLAGDFFRRVLN
ncbi:MAG: MmgE/PrpD family protein [Candidatus Dormibacter sp.]|uniref:MmgE/PrpD family protein n=1 Tax=Candidatus Dormibacter sp. TaxID=2973982 RepID=UPI000DB4C7FC|nr:MAG: 2-methylcitrate dehydratase [Candidatus Dormibacteraeota bacterium]